MKKITLVIGMIFIYGLVNGQVTKGLVAKYSFNNGNANDEVAQHHGVVYGATLTEDRFGNPNHAYSFNGPDSNKIVVANNSAIDFGNSNDFTISFWMKVGLNNGLNSVILEKALYNGICNGFYFAANNIDRGYCNGKGKFHFYTASGAFQDACADSLISDDASHWKFITGIYKGSLNRSYLYVNGKLQADSGSTTGYLSTTADLTFGSHPANIGYFTGSIDDIRIYNRSLSASEIYTLYNEKNPVIKSSFSVIAIYFWPGIIVVVMVVGLTMLFIKLRINFIKKQEKQKAARNMQIRDLEYKALSAQMNPHFIFNSLNSIQRFILENNSESAYNYMSTFSRLIRNVLNNSKSETITLTEEIDTLKLYLELETLRFKSKIEYEVIIDEDVNLSTEIPPMIIQPFVENAIWHGLMLQEKEDKKLSIHLSMLNNNCIRIVIEDTGIGIKASKERKSNSQSSHKSHGMTVTHERLAILNMKHKLKLEANIVDLQDIHPSLTGTRVELIIPKLDTEKS